MSRLSPILITSEDPSHEEDSAALHPLMDLLTADHRVCRPSASPRMCRRMQVIPAVRHLRDRQWALDLALEAGLVVGEQSRYVVALHDVSPATGLPRPSPILCIRVSDIPTSELLPFIAEQLLAWEQQLRETGELVLDRHTYSARTLEFAMRPNGDDVSLLQIRALRYAFDKASAGSFTDPAPTSSSDAAITMAVLMSSELPDSLELSVRADQLARPLPLHPVAHLAAVAAAEDRLAAVSRIVVPSRLQPTRGQSRVSHA